MTTTSNTSCLENRSFPSRRGVSYGSREGTSDFRLQTSDFRLQTSDFRLQTSDFRLRIQTSDFRLQTSNIGSELR